ncbi:hypothetical protein [Phyllobacterium lublinensis]|uniref:hypothetical protein n=1 Tax=Phyllobacterium lublinensis TaxID=2875708 RepID=UPI001CCD1EE8|nr:hypothetical protein [Phyllobacterium sp. 2063]MBZ9653440.1 hypothetical protein [Phyllobacterium sp. 2063]
MGRGLQPVTMADLLAGRAISSDTGRQSGVIAVGSWIEALLPSGNRGHATREAGRSMDNAMQANTGQRGNSEQESSQSFEHGGVLTPPGSQWVNNVFKISLSINHLMGCHQQLNMIQSDHLYEFWQCNRIANESLGTWHLNDRRACTAGGCRRSIVFARIRNHPY